MCYIIIGDNMNIDINLADKKMIHHRFNNETLNPELANYIYDECIGFTKDTDIEINICAEETLNSDDKNNIERLIRNYFKQEIKEDKIRKKHLTLYYTFITVIGVIFLVSSFLITETFIKEVSSIIGWVALWEIIYNIFFVEKRKIFVLYVIINLVMLILIS